VPEWLARLFQINIVIGIPLTYFSNYYCPMEISRSRYVPVRRNFAVFCVFGVSKNQ
jgi:hypothetical protein